MLYRYYEYLYLHIPLTRHWHVASRSKSNLQPTITLSLVWLYSFRQILIVLKIINGITLVVEAAKKFLSVSEYVSTNPSTVDSVSGSELS